MTGEKMGRNSRKRKRKKGEKGQWLLRLAVVFFAALFCVSAFQIGKIVSEYRQGTDEYEDIRKRAVKTGEGEVDRDDGTKEVHPEEPSFVVDFTALLQQNPDTVAWIRFAPEPAEISYPVVQGKDNEQYLHQTFYGRENASGAIFLNAYNRADFTDRNTVIYGHRMKNGSMFRNLEDYQERSFWEKNPYFYIYTPDGYELKYHIFSTGVVKDTSDTYQTQFGSEQEFQEFLSMTKKNAEYDTGIEPGMDSRIVTLSTCTRASDEHRYVVTGVLEGKEKCREE